MALSQSACPVLVTGATGHVAGRWVHIRARSPGALSRNVDQPDRTDHSRSRERPCVTDRPLGVSMQDMFAQMVGRGTFR